MIQISPLILYGLPEEYQSPLTEPDGISVAKLKVAAIKIEATITLVIIPLEKFFIEKLIFYLKFCCYNRAPPTAASPQNTAQLYEMSRKNLEKSGKIVNLVQIIIIYPVEPFRGGM